MAGRGAKQRVPRKKRAKGEDAEPQLLKMSELSKRSGVPGPTIKHYIREGLLPGPEVRTSRNMAYYDARLASRIRVIKELQAERFLPLRVIGELLEEAPSDRIRADRDVAQRKQLTQLAPAIEPENRQRRKRSEVMKTFGLSKPELEGLERTGVLELRGEGETAGYAGIDLQLLEILADLRRLGLGDIFPVSVAEPYMAAVRKLVEFEIDLFRHRALAAPLPAPLPDVARQAVALGERLVVGLRAKLLPVMLEQLGRVFR
jgi:DNA-binding transcriptional MerR regulator